MEIAYELNEKDFTEAFSAHRNRNAAAKWIRRIGIYLVAGFLSVLLFGSIRTHNIKPHTVFRTGCSLVRNSGRTSYPMERSQAVPKAARSTRTKNLIA
jgi:hypothetical protein